MGDQGGGDPPQAQRHHLGPLLVGLCLQDQHQQMWLRNHLTRRAVRQGREAVSERQARALRPHRASAATAPNVQGKLVVEVLQTFHSAIADPVRLMEISTGRENIRTWADALYSHQALCQCSETVK